MVRGHGGVGAGGENERGGKTGGQRRRTKAGYGVYGDAAADALKMRHKKTETATAVFGDGRRARAMAVLIGHPAGS